MDRIKQEYKPPTAAIIMGFDRNDTLIFLQTYLSENAENFSRDLNELVDMSELYRESNKVVRHGKLTPCVTVHMTTVKSKIDNVSSGIGAAYFYTCSE